MTAAREAFVERFQPLLHADDLRIGRVAMFDEVDEGTAIFKCVNDVPVGQKSKFVTFEGLPSDFYLKMVGDGTKLIHGETSMRGKASFSQRD